jgi:hypothetical protein
MTRTDVMASSRPRTVSAAPMRKGSPGVLRRLTVLPVLLALALAAPTAAFAVEPTSNYTQKPTPPTPSTGTSPSKESSPASTTPTTTPSKETAPSTTSATPAKAAKASTLPFTGFDLRWSLGVGLLLIGAGFSIVVVQRRQGRRREH